VKRVQRHRLAWQAVHEARKTVRANEISTGGERHLRERIEAKLVEGAITAELKRAEAAA
jgi:hypothetical protein